MSLDNQGALSPQQQKELDTVNWRIEFQKKIVEQLKADERVQHYFEKYTADSVKSFINHYSLQKTYWHQLGTFYIQQRDNHELQWIEAAWWHLEMIQQKKLFDLQCLWRAEQIHLPGVELCCEFGFWEQNILNCPFVDPIAPDEVEMYQQYLAENNNVELKDDLPSLFFLQDYRGIKQCWLSDGAEGHQPEWYQFYDSRKGTAMYMNLQDIRGDKESFYITLARDTTPEKREAISDVYRAFFEPNTGAVLDKNGKEFLNAFEPETLQYFVEAFEDKQTKEFYRAAAWFRRHDEELDGINEAIALLLSANKTLPIEEHYDWKEAIFNAARNYTIAQIAEHLSEAYEQYRLNLSMNISFPNRSTGHLEDTKKLVIGDILLGRKLNGEPEDLNF